MDREEVIQKFQSLRPWKRAGERAPHKPLLVLYAIRRLLRDRRRLTPYCEIDEHLEKLLQEFGFKQTAQRPEYPFWRLRNDSVWKVTYAHKIVPNSAGDVRKNDLIEHDVSGGFHKAIADQFQNDSKLVSEVIQILLYNNFPYSIHEDILEAVGIESPLQIFQWQMPDSKQRRRDRNFRENILKVYKYKCAVCGFDAKLDAKPLALEAAHIKWHTQCGPDKVVNGLALCSLHHKLFDRGALALSRQREILVSDEVCGSEGFQEWLNRFRGRQINLPQMTSDYPAEEYIDWHAKVIFRGNYSNS